MTEYISKDAAICAGHPHITGTRISVEIIQDHVAAGYTPEEIRHIYPHLSLDQIHAAIEYGRAEVTPAHTSLAG